LREGGRDAASGGDQIPAVLLTATAALGASCSVRSLPTRAPVPGAAAGPSAGQATMGHTCLRMWKEIQVKRIS